MFFRVPIACLIAGAVVSLESWAAIAADQPKVSPDVWQVRTFRFPAGPLWEPEEGSNGAGLIPGSERAPEPDSTTLPTTPPLTPSDHAPEAEWDEFIRKSSRIMERAMKAQGVMAPNGSFFLHDVASGTLVARSTANVLDQIEAIAEDMKTKSPMSIAFSLEIVQAEAAIIRQVVAETTAKPDQTSDWQRMRTLVEQGKATLVRHLQIETRSGQRVSTREGADLDHATGLKLDAEGRVEFTKKSQCTGTLLELDSVIGPDAFTIDADVTIEHHFAGPEKRTEISGQAGALGRLEVPVIDFHCARIKTALTLLDGSTELLGVWTPEGKPEFAKGDVMQAAFFGANLLPLWPEENKTLLGKLERHIAKAGAPPPLPKQQAAATPTSATKAPPGMETWSFQVPPDFLNCYYASEKPGAPTDPFKPHARADPSNPGVLMRDGGPSPADIFKQAGIPVPEGADMRYEPTTGTYFVTNTPANLKLVRDFVDQLYRRSQAKLLSQTLYVVESDGTLIRRLATEASTRADHQSLWKQVEDLAARGQMKIQSTMRLEGRSGQRVYCEAGTLHMSAGALRFGDPAEAPAKAAKEGAQSKSPDLHLMTAKNETRMVGTRLELDPVIGPDGWTVDVNVAMEHDFAPPTLRAASPPSGAGVFRAEIPFTDFHFGKVLTSLTFTSGMTKLIGIWPIEGGVEQKGEDIMQAAFLRVDVVTLLKE